MDVTDLFVFSSLIAFKRSRMVKFIFKGDVSSQV